MINTPFNEAVATIHSRGFKIRSWAWKIAHLAHDSMMSCQSKSVGSAARGWRKEGARRVEDQEEGRPVVDITCGAWQMTTDETHERVR